MQKKPYYLVAVPEGKAAVDLLRLQSLLSRRYNMYEEPYPVLHITVAVIEREQDIGCAIPIIHQISRQTLPFSVLIHGERCFDDPFFSVGIGVTGEKLSFLAGRLEGALLREGINARSFAHWHFHVHLIHPVFATRVWQPDEFQEACKIIKRLAPSISCPIRKLQLWEPEFPPLKILAEFATNGDDS